MKRLSGGRLRKEQEENSFSHLTDFWIILAMTPVLSASRSRARFQSTGLPAFSASPSSAPPFRGLMRMKSKEVAKKMFENMTRELKKVV